MVEIRLDESLSVVMNAGTEKPCAYSVHYDGKEIVQYETSGDPRTVGGRIGLRNIIHRRVPDDRYDKEGIGERLSAAIADQEAELTEELGPR